MFDLQRYVLGCEIYHRFGIMLVHYESIEFDKAHFGLQILIFVKNFRVYAVQYFYNSFRVQLFELMAECISYIKQITARD